MVQLNWRRRSAVVMVCLLGLLILAAASLTPAAVAQSETTPEAAATPQVAATPDPAATADPATTAVPEATADPAATPAPRPELPSGGSPFATPASFREWTPDQWADVLVSVAIFLVIAIFGWRLIIWLGTQVAQRTGTSIDDQVLAASHRPLQLISVMLGIQVAYKRLDFLRPTWPVILDNVFFILYAILGSMIAWVFIDSGVNFYEEKARASDADMNAINRLLPLVRTFSRGLLVIVTIIIILHHFGIEITAVVAALGLTGFAISLAARDTLTNIIAGLTIAVNRPFRINDRIYNKDIDGWVDVVEIGLRSTKVLTRDNRMVIIPNTDLSDNTVINYTFPDRSYRLQVDIGIAYGTAFDKLRQVLHDAVRQVDGVMPNKPVQVLFIEFGETAMIFRVRWWIANYADMRAMNDRVYQAIQEALDSSDISSPGPVLDVNYHLAQSDADRLAQALQGAPPHSGGEES